MSADTVTGSRVLEALRAAVVFPGRDTVHPKEVAHVLTISVDQVTILKDVGLFDALPISLGGDRCHYRITVASYDRFIVNGGTAQLNKNGHSKNGHSKKKSRR